MKTIIVGAVDKDAETIVAACSRVPGSTSMSSLSLKYDSVTPQSADNMEFGGWRIRPQFEINEPKLKKKP